MSIDTIPSSPIFYQNDDFQTIQIRVLFPFEENENDLAKTVLLPSMLNFMNQKYPKEDLFQIAKKEKYILSARCHSTIIGTTGCFIFDLIIPTADALGKKIYQEQIQFFKEMIYHPLIIDKGFSSFELDREKKNLRNAIENSFKNMHSYQDIMVRKHMDTLGVLSRDIAWHPELIDSLTPQDLYQYYSEFIYQKRPIIYIMGNDSSREIVSICEKKLIQKDVQSYMIEKHFDYFLAPRKTYLVIEEESEFRDSSLSFIYKVKDMSTSDKVYIILVKDLLSSLSSSLLRKKLREEQELIYSSKVISYLHYGALEVTAFIRKEDYNKAYQTMMELMEELKKEDVIAPLLHNIKERKRINLYRKLDNKYLILDDYILHDLDIDATLEEYYEMIQKITAHKLSLFIDRLLLDTIYFLKEKKA